MIKLKSLIAEINAKVEVPDEPGTVSISPNHLRLYHYTSVDPKILKREGLKRSAAKGHTYGEPDVVWASLTLPSDSKIFVEFSMAIDDPRFAKWAGNAPDSSAGVEYYKGRGSDFTIYGDISPSEFIAIHEPWHHTYRYLVKENMVEEILRGDFDHLLDGKLPNEAKAIMTIKQNFGK